MSKDNAEAPRGDAAWQAAKQRISKNNEAAYARAREQRSAQEAEAHRRRRAAELREMANLPKPGGQVH